jgi:hypothetical protein
VISPLLVPFWKSVLHSSNFNPTSSQCQVLGLRNKLTPLIVYIPAFTLCHFPALGYWSITTFTIAIAIVQVILRITRLSLVGFLPDHLMQILTNTHLFRHHGLRIVPLNWSILRFHNHMTDYSLTGEWTRNSYATTHCPWTCAERLTDPTNFDVRLYGIHALGWC